MLAHFPALTNEHILLLLTSIKNTHNSFLVYKNKFNVEQETHLIW